MDTRHPEPGFGGAPLVEATARIAAFDRGLAGLTNSFPEVDFESHKVGISGKLASLETVLADSDRVEIYRPLTVDPKTVKRKPKAAAAESEQVRSVAPGTSFS
jgi:putative ubiquitin-RnfH superfamily antitoxin RatB of RatAB toxin-antitoxin module